MHDLVRRRWLWLVGAVVVLYAASLSSSWVVYPDSSVYLLLGKSLADGHGCSVCGHPQGKYPPGFPSYLATMYRLGLGNMLWLNGCMLLMALATLVVSYRLLREHTTWRWAFLLTLTLAVAHEMYRYNVAQLSDIPFMLLVTAGVWCLIRGCRGGRGWLEAGTLLLIASCWVRVLGIPLALAALAGLLLEPRQISRWRVWLNGAVLATGVALTAVCLYSRDRVLQSSGTPPPTYASTFSRSFDCSLAERLMRPMANAYNGGATLSQLLTGQRMPAWAALPLVWLPVLVGLYFLLRKRHYVAACAAGGYLSAIFVLQPPLARYYLPVGPVLLLCFVQGIRRMAIQLSKSPTWAANVAAGVTLVLIALNLPKDLRQIYRQYGTEGQSCREYHDMVQVAEYLRAHAPGNGRFVMGKHATIVAYLSGMDCLLISPELSKQQMPEREIHAMLLDQRISHVVVRNAPRRRRAFHATVRRGIDNWGDYQMVYEQGDFQVFGRAAAGAALRPADGPRVLAQQAAVRVADRPAGNRDPLSKAP